MANAKRKKAKEQDPRRQVEGKIVVTVTAQACYLERDTAALGEAVLSTALSAGTVLEVSTDAAK